MKKTLILFLFSSLFFVVQATTLSVNSTAGGLSSAITAGGGILTEVTNLTVTGTIDARDFVTMRDYMPLLAVVDLSGVTIAAYTGTEGTVASTTDYPANEIPQYSFYATNYIGKTSLTSFTMPSSVTSIGNYAFGKCSGLTGSLTIPSSVTSIGNGAFYYCSGLTGSLTISSSVTSIGISAFYYCSGLNGSLTIPSSVTSIGNTAFYCCIGLTGSLTIPSSVTSIGICAFYYCSGLNGSLTIPSSITSIGNAAFYYCSSISSIKAYGTTPNSITLGGNVFKGISQSVCKLYVPVGTKTLYAAADQWNVFPITEGFPPTIATQAVSSISATSAIGNGNITDLGAPNPTAYGVCWNTNGTPTTSDSKVDNGEASVSGAFITSMTELSSNTTYYVRAYATNSAGTSYGDVLSFITPRLTVTWDGSGWSSSTPVASDNVVIDGTFSDVGFSCNNLTVNAEKQLTISSGNLTVAGNLTLKSDVTGTASLIYNGGAVSVTGTTTIERYMTADAWHLITPPVSGQTIGSFLTANTNIKSNPNSGFETYRALKDYNESTNTWNDLTYTTGTTDLLSLGKGYAVWPSSAGVVSFTGTLPTGNQTVTVARTGDYGWNCIGNPYASSIAINANTAAGTSCFINANSDNMETSFWAIYVWDQTQSKYLTFNQSDAAYYLPVDQAFFVKAKTGATQISFTSAMQQHQPGATFRSATTEKPEIDIDATMNDKQSTAKVRFIENATKGLDFGYDAGAFKTGFDVYTKLVEDNGVDFAIQSLPVDPGNGYVIPVGLETSESGTLKLSLTPINLPEGCTLTFEDTQSNTSTEIDESTKTLTAEVTSGTTLGRFYLNVSKSSTGIEGTSSNLTVTSSDGEIIIHGAVRNDATATLYDLQGRRLTTVLLSGSINRIRTDNFTDGIYLLHLKQQGNIRNLKVVVKK